MEDDKMFKELFEIFNSRYDIKFNNKLNEIDAIYKMDKDLEIKENDRLLIIDYLIFC